MGEPHLRGVSQTTVYEGGQPTAVVFHCLACGEEWVDPDLDAALAAQTSSRGDRLTQEHWDVCQGREKPTSGENDTRCSHCREYSAPPAEAEVERLRALLDPDEELLAKLIRAASDASELNGGKIGSPPADRMVRAALAALRGEATDDEDTDNNGWGSLGRQELEGEVLTDIEGPVVEHRVHVVLWLLRALRRPPMADEKIRDYDEDDLTVETRLYGHPDVEEVRYRIIGGLPTTLGARAEFVVEAVKHTGRWEEATDGSS